MTLKVCGVLLAVVAAPFIIAATTGCGFTAPMYSVSPSNSYGCSCTCSPEPPRHRTLRVSFNEDDSEQQTNTNILLNSPDLDFLNGRLIGLRFRDVQIPKGATIDSANIAFIAAASSNAGNLVVQIAAQAADDAPVFTTTAGDLSGRPKTSNPVSWPLSAAWTTGSTQTTPNFGSVVKQVTDRTGWVAGNDLVILITGTSGTPLRQAVSYDGNPAKAAVLTVEYEEPVTAQVGPIDFQVCVLPVDNINIGGVEPDANRLAHDCTDRVQATLIGIAEACGYPTQCSCSVKPDSQKYAGKCDEACAENTVDGNCADFDPSGGNVQATNAPGDEPVCVANSPLSSEMYGRRTTCLVEGNAHIQVDGDTRNPDAAGIVKFIGDPCPGGTCAVRMEYNLDVDSITFGNFLKSATFSDLGSLGETPSGNETMLGMDGAGTFAADAFALSAQGRRGSDKRGLNTTNGDAVDVEVFWGSEEPSCTVKGTLLGSVDPELKRCENAGPSANVICDDDSDCTQDDGCSDEVCNCVKVGDSEILLSIDVAGDILNQPPTANAGLDQQLECSDAAVNSIVLDGSGSTDLDDNIALFSWLKGSRIGTEVGFDEKSKVEQAKGTENYVLRVIDAFGESDEDTTTVNIVDTTPPVMTCSVAHPVLNQTNRLLVNAGLVATAIDKCQGALPVTVQVFGDEDDQESTAGYPPYLSSGILNRDSPDAKSIAPATLRLRAERKGNGNGRVYLMVVKATDSSSNSAFNCCTMTVPFSTKAADQTSAAQQATAARNYCLSHSGMPPAGYFVIGDGPVIGTKQ